MLCFIGSHLGFKKHYEAEVSHLKMSREGVHIWACPLDKSADSIMSGHAPVMSNAIYKTSFVVTMKPKAPVNHWRTAQHLNKLMTVLNLNLKPGL